MHSVVGRVHLRQLDVRAGVRRVLLSDVGHAVRRSAPALGDPCVRLLRPPVVVVRAPHEQQLGKVVEKDDPNPPRHAVGAGSAEVPVDDDDGDEDREYVHDEGEQQVLSNERDADGGRREDLRDEQQEYDQSEQDRYTHRHLLAGVGRQIEDGHAEEGDENARYDEVDGVEQRLAADLKREGHLLLDVTVHAVRRVLQLPWTRDNVPRAAVHVVTQVDAVLVFVVPQSYLQPMYRQPACTDNPRVQITRVYRQPACTAYLEYHFILTGKKSSEKVI